MSTTRTTTRRASGPISRLEAFTTSGALSGEFDSGYGTAGRLDPAFRSQFQTAQLAAALDESGDSALYVVRSYSTPIAWVQNGIATIPDTRYSVTTSAHQGQARLGLMGFAQVTAPIQTGEVA